VAWRGGYQSGDFSQWWSHGRQWSCSPTREWTVTAQPETHARPSSPRRSPRAATPPSFASNPV
jgi:hypothetical protein